MTWVWHFAREHEDWGADIDYNKSAPFTDMMSEEQMRNTVGLPYYKSNSGLKRFASLHSPPIGIIPVADALWREIIMRFVPKERVQFVPIRLNARGEICDEFSWIIPLAKVYCLDLEKSVINRKLIKNGTTIVYGVKEVVHRSNCMDGLHLATDMHWTGHLVVSNELKEALAATGQDSVFYRPEEVVTADNMFDRWNGNSDKTKH